MKLKRKAEPIIFITICLLITMIFQIITCHNLQVTRNNLLLLNKGERK